MQEAPVIVMSGAPKQYAPGMGVFELDLEVPPGLIIGLIGPSGSGKTTIVRLTAGITTHDSGAIEVLGQCPTRFDAQTRARIAYMPQSSILYPDLTLRENLRFAASLYGMPYRRKQVVERLIEFVELGSAMDRFPRHASGGEKRRLMLASTLIHDPDLILVDEPTAGIDPVLRRKFWDRFAALSDQGRSVVVTTQYVAEAAYCDLVVVLDDGRILMIETPDDLRRIAYGGELIDVVLAKPPDRSTVSSIQELGNGQPIAWRGGRDMRLTVDDPGTANAAISRWANDRGVELEKIEVFLPPFDDVFLELVTRQRPADAA